jgi:hypothetical protein
MKKEIFSDLCGNAHVLCTYTGEDTNLETDIQHRPRMNNRPPKRPASGSEHRANPAVDTSETPMAATQPQKNLENFPICPGNGHVLSTYTGEDRNLKHHVPPTLIRPQK